jgi:hypothetical protein
MNAVVTGGGGASAEIPAGTALLYVQYVCTVLYSVLMHACHDARNGSEIRDRMNEKNAIWQCERLHAMQNA